MKLRSPYALLAPLAFAVALPAMADQSGQVYTHFPVTLSSYNGDASSSVSYSGQVARHLLHNSLKALSSSDLPSDQRKKSMKDYFSKTTEGREILNPKPSKTLSLVQKTIDEVSGGKQLADKAYKGTITGWPGNMTASETIDFMIDKSAATNNGFDPLTGYDYTQLISKLTMGSVFYYQAVNGYLTKNLDPSVKPNDQAYKEGAAYTGKEHVWDEAFGYFGAPAHVLKLSPGDVYNIAKLTPEGIKAADANKDGKIDLKTEMAYGHAYYAAAFDKSGKTRYLETIAQAFYDGRKLIASAKGKKLTQNQYGQLNQYATIIKTEWEKVIAEAVFKYAGSVYADLKKLDAVIKTNGDVASVFRDYSKHWGELKGFALSLQASGKDLGETSVMLNRLIGFGPVLLGDTQVSGIDADGNYIQTKSKSLQDYQLDMVKVQKLMVDKFKIAAREKDALGNMKALVDQLSSGTSAEND